LALAGTDENRPFFSACLSFVNQFPDLFNAQIEGDLSVALASRANQTTRDFFHQIGSEVPVMVNFGATAFTEIDQFTANTHIETCSNTGLCLILKKKGRTKIARPC
jgi:hypothetical protein